MSYFPARPDDKNIEKDILKQIKLSNLYLGFLSDTQLEEKDLD